LAAGDFNKDGKLDLAVAKDTEMSECYLSWLNLNIYILIKHWFFYVVL
jgi:hypothetical protein